MSKPEPQEPLYRTLSPAGKRVFSIVTGVALVYALLDWLSGIGLVRLSIELQARLTRGYYYPWATVVLFLGLGAIIGLLVAQAYDLVTGQGFFRRNDPPSSE